MADVTEKILAEKNIKAERAFVEHICGLVKERCTFMNDVWDNAFFFFQRPEKYDVDAVKPKWTEEKRQFFDLLISRFEDLNTWENSEIEKVFKDLAAEKNIKVGELQMPFRIMLCGGKFGPPVFEIAHTIGKNETVERIKLALTNFNF